MVILLYLALFPDFIAGYLLPNTPIPYGHYFPYIPGAVNHINQINNGHLVNIVHLGSSGYINPIQVKEINTSEFNENSDKTGIEDSKYHDEQRERGSSEQYHLGSSGEQEEEEEEIDSGSQGEEDKLMKGFHDVYRRHEKKSKTTFWDSHEAKGDFFKSGMDMGSYDEEETGKKMDSAFHDVEDEKKMENKHDWGHGFVTSWKSTPAPDGSHFSYADDMKEDSSLFPKWRWRYDYN